MDFVGFESFSENDPLPSPQPSLSLPLKSNIENLGFNLSNFNNLRNLLKQNASPESTEDSGAQLAEKYAYLSLQLLESAEEVVLDGENGPELPVQPASASSSTTSSSTLSKRLSRALNPSLSDHTTRELFGRLELKIADVGTLVDPGVAGSMARKNLRGEIESDLIRSHMAVLADYAKPIKALKALGDKVAALDRHVCETNELLAKDHELTAQLSEQVGELTGAKTTVNLKKALLVSFREQFTLNEYDTFVLGSNDINADFFSALARAEAINDRCLILLALDNPDLGHKILAKNNELITRAVDKVLAFCNRTMSNAYLLNNRARVDLLHLCLRYLQNKPDHLSTVVDAFVASRSSALVEEFDLQASGHGADESSLSLTDSRPVFYSSHDPVRFIADLLAYVHSLVVNESDTVENLFGRSAEFASTANEMVSRILASLARPIRAQIEQLISVETKLPVIFQMFSHLDLYSIMFRKLPNASGVLDAIDETIKMTQDKIITIVTNRLATVRNSNLAQIDLSTDLQPPEWIIDFYGDLLPIVDAMTTETVFNLPQNKHDEFLSLIVDEPREIFYEHLSTVSKTFGKRDTLIFKLNFLDLVLTKIMPLSILSDKVLDINHSINDFSVELREVQLQGLLDNCQLTDFWNIINMICPIDNQMLEPSIYLAITENKLFTKEIIGETNATVQLVLPSALIDIQLALMKLNSPIIVTGIITASSIQFATFYKLFSDIIETYLGERLLIWTDEEVATLLGVEGSYSQEITQASY